MKAFSYLRDDFVYGLGAGTDLLLWHDKWFLRREF